MVKIKTDVIATYQDGSKPQHQFKIVQEIDETKTLYEIEKYWLKGCVMKVRSPKDLVKLSLFVEEDESNVMTEVCYLSNGKYFFQPDQRGLVENLVIEHYPKTAKNTVSYKEWLEDFKTLREKQSYRNSPITCGIGESIPITT